MGREADAFALSKDSLRPLTADFQGARILEEAFHVVGVAVAVPKNRPAALAYVSKFMEEAKARAVCAARSTASA